MVVYVILLENIFIKKEPREVIIVPDDVPNDYFKIANYLDRRIDHREQGRVYKAKYKKF